MNSKKEKLLEETYERIINVGLCIVPYEDLSDLIAPELMLFGTTKDEKVFSFGGLDEMFKSQYEQMLGFEPSLDRKRIFTRITEDGKIAIITEEVILTISSPEVVNTILIRCSCVMEYIDNKWKLTHWHASTPVETENDHWHMEEWKRENEKLQKLVDEQTADLKKKNHGLEIEAALERVRAHMMAMHHTSELQRVIHSVHEELLKLDLSISGGSFIVINSEIETEIHCWGAGGTADTSDEVHIPRFEKPFYTNLLKGIKSGPGFFTEEFSQEEKFEFFSFLFQHEPWSGLSAEQQSETLSAPGGYTRSCSVSKHTSILIINHFGEVFSEAENDILKRFGKVFEQSYTRFLDLQKAETQAREAQIEAALERVRSRSMAMHTSQELKEVALELRKQMGLLGQKDLEVCAIHLYGHNEDSFESWSAMKAPGTEAEIVQSQAHFPKKGIRIVDEMMHHYTIGTKDYILVNEGEKIAEWFKVMKKHAPELHASILDSIGKVPVKQLKATWAVADFSGGALVMVTYGEPDEVSRNLLRRSANVFEQAYVRFLDLQKAEAQAREARIEAALEKVRSRSLAMHKSDELNEVVKVLFQKLTELQIPSTAVGIQTFTEDSRDMRCFVCGDVGTGIVISQYLLPYFDHPIFRDYDEVREKNPELYVGTYSKGMKDSFYDVVLKLPELKDLPTEVEEMIRGSEIYEITMVPAKKSILAVNDFYGNPLSTSQINILKRFSKVFDQTYTRFLDLQKAEAQAREAVIEASLERVRAQTMAMHNSEDVGKCIVLMFEELTALGVNEKTRFGIGILNHENENNQLWTARKEGGEFKLHIGHLEMSWHPLLKSARKAWKAQESLHRYVLEGEDLLNYYKMLNQAPDYKIQIPIEELPEREYHYGFVFEHGFFYAFSPIEFPEDLIRIIHRFSSQFAQTYRRYLDLKKAEAQAREAQIELSLERIRAQVTAMRQSDELFDIVVSMRKEFISLGHEADYFWHMKWTPENYDMSMTSEDGERVGMIISVPKFVHDEIPRLAEWEKSDSPIIALDLNGQEAWDYIDKMNTYGKYEQADPHAPIEEDIMAIGGLTFVIARTTHGEIGFSLAGQVPNPPQESTETLIRFAGVFDLAYRRFEDLLTAEKQNRKAKIELALERVRARALAMQHPEELIEVAQVMREEMGLLGVEELETSSIYINKNTVGKAECWYSIKDIRDGAKTYVADHFDLNYQDTWVGRQMLDFYQSEETKTSILMKGKDRVEWINYCANQSTKLEGYYGTEIPERTYHLIKFSSGAIGAATPREISSESWDLLRRAALVFSLAYSRFKDLSQAREDLKKLKKAKAKAEKALNELKSAQEQLIQQEKLASLGQLTAGIAHEIKNPLNFVNNFSDLSRELIEEVFEELGNLEASGTKEEIISILNDVKSNLTKVHEHGTRADSIVTSMLQHSRASGSKREAKAFNPLVKEFVNLSYHGMRAGKAPINVDIDLQLDPKVGDVTLISEDFSRVILNLCNNAFDAMRDKLRTEDRRQKTEDRGRDKEVYLPKLTVKTTRQKDKVILSIGDNGGGIPEEIQDKILQPFFTTKKGTEGTGLGLSITNDIIKAHGGQLDIQSQPGSTIFEINLTH